MVDKRTSRVDCAAVVERFESFLANNGLLLVKLLVRLPLRRIIVVIAWFCYLETLRKRQGLWRPGVRKGDAHDQCTDVLVQSSKKPMLLACRSYVSRSGWDLLRVAGLIPAPQNLASQWYRESCHAAVGTPGCCCWFECARLL